MVQREGYTETHTKREQNLSPAGRRLPVPIFLERFRSKTTLHFDSLKTPSASHPISWFFIDVARLPVRSGTPYCDFVCALAKKGPRWRIYAECCVFSHSGFAQSIVILAVRARSRTPKASAFSLDGLFSLRAPRTPRMRRRESSRGMRSRDAVPVRLRVGAVSYTHLTLPTNREV